MIYVYSWSIWQGHIVCYVDHKFWFIVDILKAYDTPTYRILIIVEIDSTNFAIYFYGCKSWSLHKYLLYHYDLPY